MTGPDPIDVALLVIARLDAQELPYILGGSLVTMLFGEPRMTHEVDIVADMRTEHVEPFVAGLETESTRTVLRSSRSREVDSMSTTCSPGLARSM